MLPDADVLSFKFGVAYGNVLVIAGLPIRWCLRLLSRCYGADWTPMVQGWADSLLGVFNVSLLSHSLLDSVTTGGKGVGGCGRGQMNAFSPPGR